MSFDKSLNCAGAGQPMIPPDEDHLFWRCRVCDRGAARTLDDHATSHYPLWLLREREQARRKVVATPAEVRLSEGGTNLQPWGQ